MSVMQYTQFVMPAGDQASALVQAWSMSAPANTEGPSLHSVKISAAGPTFGITLYFAVAAASAAEDVVIVYSNAAIPVSLVNPSGTITVANASMDCLEFLVPRNVIAAVPTPMSLFVTTTGKVGVGRIRMAWKIGDPTLQPGG